MAREMKRKNLENIDIVIKRSKDVLHCNVEWLLNSGINIKNGGDKGALYGWKYLNPPSYPFVYSEITGYAISCFLWIHSHFGRSDALNAAKVAAEWITKNMNSEFLLVAGYRKQKNFVEKGDLSSQIYLFDNAMIFAGLLNLYKINREKSLLRLACKMADSLINYFFNGSLISLALVDKLYRPRESAEKKWSASPGPYLSKLSIAFLELYKETNDVRYAKISNSVCDLSISLQRPDGRFETTPHSEITFLHPHLYACEGLIYSSIFQSEKRYLESGIKGIRWAAKQVNSKGGLPRDNSKGSVEQSDAMCQLLRLLILCQSDLLELLGESLFESTIDLLHKRILDFCIMSSDINRGGVRYQIGLESACSWCAMFCMQALELWQENTRGLLKRDARWIDFFV